MSFAPIEVLVRQILSKNVTRFLKIFIPGEKVVCVIPLNIGNMARSLLIYGGVEEIKYAMPLLEKENLTMIRKTVTTLTVAIFTTLFIAGSALAVPIDWDYYLYETGADTTVYNADIGMEFDGSQITFYLTNTSTGTAGESSWDLLSGLGFDLPDTFMITGGTATAEVGYYNKDTATYVSGPVDVSGEWGWGEGIGQFNTTIPGIVLWDVSAMEASTDQLFAAGASLASPDGLAGPDFGMKADGVTVTGQSYVDQTAKFVLDVTYDGIWTEEGLAAFIQENDVAIAFGSPDRVPEPGTLLLLGIGMVCLAGLRKKLI